MIYNNDSKISFLSLLVLSTWKYQLIVEDIKTKLKQITSAISQNLLVSQPRLQTKQSIIQNF